MDERARGGGKKLKATAGPPQSESKGPLQTDGAVGLNELNNGRRHKGEGTT